MRVVVVALCLLVAPSTTIAQAISTLDIPEDLQPRTIGARGTTTLGMAGYVDRFFSAERLLPTNYTAQIDVGRFVTKRLVVRGGISGSGSLGGDDSDDVPTGSGAPALHAFGGALVYFTPQSLMSLYTGVEYWAQVTQRADGDAGTMLGTLGLQGAFSSRVSLFFEGGYGIRLTRGQDNEIVSRVVGQIGVRLKL